MTDLHHPRTAGEAATQDGAHPDDLAVDRFAAAMKAKLVRKRAEGRGGWDGPDCNAELLTRLLREHVEKGDPLDVGNLAMMLHQRGERIAPAAQDGAEGERLRAEVARLSNLTTRFPEHMAKVIAAKDEPVDTRIGTLISAMEKLPKHMHRYQWCADENPAFGDKYIRHASGDNGHGMGRQWLATCPPHIEGLAEYIAAANPDTIVMLLSENAALKADATRYRWLRSRDLDVIYEGGVFAGRTPQNVALNGEDLDDAVDAALRAHEQGGA